MTGASHTIITGTVVGATCLLLGCNDTTLLAGTLLASAAAVAPDYDVFWSGMSRYGPGKMYERVAILFPFGLLFLYITALAVERGQPRHRRTSHSVVGWLVFTLGNGVASFVIATILYTMPSYKAYGTSLFVYATIYTVFASIGYGMHLLEDMLTVSGVPLFYPSTTRPYYLPLPKVKTGSIGELAYIGLAFLYGYLVLRTGHIPGM